VSYCIRPFNDAQKHMVKMRCNHGPHMQRAQSSSTCTTDQVHT